MKKCNIAIVGATGAVGKSLLSILDERNFPVDTIYSLASQSSAGKKITFGEKSLVVEGLDDFDFAKVDIALFSAGSSVSSYYAPIAAEKRCVVIDNTSRFRREDSIPLVIPEVNSQALAKYKQRYIIANPNCSTIQMLVALKPIYDAVGIKRINVATYQAVSGSGYRAIDELKEQSQALLQQQATESSIYPKQIAFNVLPHIDEFQANGYTREEMKMVWETQKIFADQTIQVNPTAVRVPVVTGHSEAIHIETKQKISASDARELLEKAPGLTVLDEQKNGGYPTPALEAAGNDTVFVGRIREDISCPCGLNLWVVSDNLRKGAALNTVQIAEIIWHDYLSEN